MPQTVSKRGLTANALRLFAMVGMLLDHAWATVVPGNFWMTCVGRLVFPIYAFQLAEGFFRTHDRKKYALAAFAGFVDYGWQGVFTVLLFYMSQSGLFGASPIFSVTP